MAALSSRGSGTAAESVSLSMATVAPEFTADQAQSLVGQVKRLASWTTHYISSSHNGNGQNIRRPTNLINGTVVQPGETFDYLAVAGPITVTTAIRMAPRSSMAIPCWMGCSAEACARRRRRCSMRRCVPASTWGAAQPRLLHRPLPGRPRRHDLGQRQLRADDVVCQRLAIPDPYPWHQQPQSVTFSIYGVPDGRHVHIRQPDVWDEKPAWTQYKYTADTTHVAPGHRTQVEFPLQTVSTLRSSGLSLRLMAASSTTTPSVRRMTGSSAWCCIGWQPGDPPPGTVLEPASHPARSPLQ